MQQTLFEIPLPWLAVAAGVFVTFLLLAPASAKESWRQHARRQLPLVGLVWLIVAGLFAFFTLAENAPAFALPIRGYGVMLLLGVVAGVSLAAYLARRMGLDQDIIFTLAIVLFVTAIAGARIFYVVQYWDQFTHVADESGATRPATLPEMLLEIVNVTQGGLVVYGSLIGGLIGGVWFLRRRGLPMLAMADLVAPSMVLGLAIGRIGCLMNGCCFGGVCEAPWVGPLWVGPITFPSEPVESPPYQYQRQRGLLQGIAIGEDESGWPIVASIDPQGPAAATDLQPGDRILSINGQAAGSADAARGILRLARSTIEIQRADGDLVHWKMPKRSLPVYPAQIYSAINAALLTLLLWAVYPFRPRDGFVMTLMLTLYPVTRFLLEIIRTDEPGRWRTGLTISQLVSLVFVVGVVALWVYIFRQSPELAFPPDRAKHAAA